MGEDWGKLIVAKGIKKLPKVQNIAQSGHTGWNGPSTEPRGPALCSEAMRGRNVLNIKPGPSGLGLGPFKL